MQEQIQDQRDEDQRLNEGLGDLVDRRADISRAVYDFHVLQVGGEILLRFADDLLHAAHRVHGVGVAGELDAEADADVSVGHGLDSDAARAGFNPRDILHADEGTVGVGTHDDVGEVLISDKAPRHTARVLFFQRSGRRLHTDGARRRLHILALDGAGDVGNGNPQLRHLVRIQPKAHRVIRTEDTDIADARHALDLVDDIDVGVILHELPRIGAVGRIKRTRQRHVRRRFLRRDAKSRDLVRQAVGRDRYIVLRLDRVHIRVRVEAEDHGQTIAARVVGVRRHVVHALGAVDLLLDDLRHRLVDDGGIRAYIAGRDADRRRRDFRILGDRQRKPRQHADDDHRNRDDDGEYRTTNKKLRQD